jgi:hypothetical protein
MKRLAILGFVLGLFVTPVQAQTVQKPDHVEFNGLIFDPPSEQYGAGGSRQYVPPREPRSSQAPRGYYQNRY